MPNILEHNRRAWDERARRRKAHTRTASARDLVNPLRALDPEGWLGASIVGRRILCLAAGGGLQSILCAAAGAHVTVADLSPEMLALDIAVADKYRLKVKTVETSMEQLGPFSPGEFDLVLQPVSTCYTPNILKVYHEVARVLKPGGLYISQHKQPVNLQAEAVSSQGSYRIFESYYRSGPLPPVVEGLEHREAGTLEFLHRWEDLIGGLCRAGFLIEDLVEPIHADSKANPGTFAHRSAFIPPYVKIKASRQGGPRPKTETSALWVG